MKGLLIIVVVAVQILLWGGAAACSSVNTSTSATMVATEPLTPSAKTLLAPSSGATAILPNPPFLPEDPGPPDLRAYLNAWPEERKLVIEPDVVVIFTYSHPAVLWDQTASLYHVPSMSRVDLNSNGKVAITLYRNEEGRQALEQVLTNESRMKIIGSLIPWE